MPSSATAAASAADVPDANACSTAVARIGVDPMFTSATPVCPFFTTAAPTMAQSWARLTNFWYENRAPGANPETSVDLWFARILAGVRNTGCAADLAITSPTGNGTETMTNRYELPAG